MSWRFSFKHSYFIELDWLNSCVIKKLNFIENLKYIFFVVDICFTTHIFLFKIVCYWNDKIEIVIRDESL